MTALHADPIDRLPDGTRYYGKIGELRYDLSEDRVQCHLCGGWYRHVGGSHLLRAHGWTIRQYRSAFRIPARVPTCGAELSSRRRESTLSRLAAGSEMAVMAGRFARDSLAAKAGARRSAAVQVRPAARKPFLKKRPELEGEWHPTRNRAIDPNKLGVSSRVVVWWSCSVCGYDWQATVFSRASSGTGCPRCLRESARLHAYLMHKQRAREQAPTRSLAATNPGLVRELHPTLNGGVDVGLVLAGSGRRLWWLCPLCGHEWQAKVWNRSHGTGCPMCARQRRG